MDSVPGGSLIATGSISSVVYNYEGSWKTFGLGTRVTSVSVRNNIERIPVLGQRNAAALVPLRYEGSWSIETYPTINASISTLAEHWGWEDEVKTPAANDIYISLGGVDGIPIANRRLISAVTSRVSITAREGEIVRLSIDGVFQKEDSTPPNTNIIESGTPLTFANGVVLVDNNEVALVQSIDMTINVNPNPIYALKSRYFQDVYLRMLEADGRMTVVATDSSWIDAVNNLTSYNEVVLRFSDNPNSSTPFIYDEVALVGVQVNELTHSVEPNELVVYDVSFIARGVRFGIEGGVMQ